MTTNLNQQKEAIMLIEYWVAIEATTRTMVQITIRKIGTFG